MRRDCVCVLSLSHKKAQKANCAICIDGLCYDESPVLVDVMGDGFALTNFENGVNFDLNGDGIAEHLSWTAAGSDDAWLALDRNNNGTIDNGRELFGNFTPQSNPPEGITQNGFAAMPPMSVKPVFPGKHLEITLTDDRLNAMHALLIDTGFLVTSTLQIRVNLIGYSDGKAWSGQMVERQPKGGWGPVGDK